MGRPSNRKQRRQQILHAFAKVLADHGYAGATIAAIADRASLSPGLLHYHFKSKDELLRALTERLMADFRDLASTENSSEDPLFSYAEAALGLSANSDRTIARCWVGLFAQALCSPLLFKQFRRLLDTEILHIQKRSQGSLSTQDASAVLAFIVGALVLGAFAPRKTAGFAAPALRTFIGALQRESRGVPPVSATVAR